MLSYPTLVKECHPDVEIESIIRAWKVGTMKRSSIASSLLLIMCFISSPPSFPHPAPHRIFFPSVTTALASTPANGMMIPFAIGASRGEARRQQTRGRLSRTKCTRLVLAECTKTTWVAELKGGYD